MRIILGRASVLQMGAALLLRPARFRPRLQNLRRRFLWPLLCCGCFPCGPCKSAAAAMPTYEIGTGVAVLVPLTPSGAEQDPEAFLLEMPVICEQSVSPLRRMVCIEMQSISL